MTLQLLKEISKIIHLKHVDNIVNIDNVLSTVDVSF